MHKLTALHTDIATRVNSIRAGHPDWLCREGCDGCCRRLAAIPGLTAAEWALLQDGLAELPAELLQEISLKIAVLATQTARPFVCPLLNQTSGACLVYAHRPVACRTYGFYVQRELGLYCQDIQAQVAGAELAEVVWGNHDAIDRRLGELGELKELTAWFMQWRGVK